MYSYGAYDYFWCWGAGPTTTSISVTSSSLDLGKGTVISGSVEDMSPFSQQHPELQSPVVAGVPVVLSYVNVATDAWTDFATVTTASDGTFTYNFTPLSAGFYKVVARFEGDGTYEWSSGQAAVQVGPASSATSTAEAPAYTSMDVAIIAAVAVAIVIGIVNLYATRMNLQRVRPKP